MARYHLAPDPGNARALYTSTMPRDRRNILFLALTTSAICVVLGKRLLEQSRQDGPLDIARLYVAGSLVIIWLGYGLIWSSQAKLARFWYLLICVALVLFPLGMFEISSRLEQAGW